MVREQREAEQQAEQVGENHPLVRQVQRQAAEAGAGLEAGEPELVEHDHAEADERDLERMMMKQCDAGEGQAEQHEIDRHAERDAGGGDHDGAGEQPALALEQPQHHGFHFSPAP